MGVVFSSRTRTLSSPEDDESFEFIDESLSAAPEPVLQTELEACILGWEREI